MLTGGGSQLKHLKQLVEYITGMDTRIGYPESIWQEKPHRLGNQSCFCNRCRLIDERPETDAKTEEQQAEDKLPASAEEASGEVLPLGKTPKHRKSILERWVDKFKEF